MFQQYMGDEKNNYSNELVLKVSFYLSKSDGISELQKDQRKFTVVQLANCLRVEKRQRFKY